MISRTLFHNYCMYLFLYQIISYIILGTMNLCGVDSDSDGVPDNAFDRKYNCEEKAYCKADNCRYDQ